MKKKVYCTQSAHMDLFWMARMDRCMRMGAGIIEDAVKDLLIDPSKAFVIETVRFLEFYLDVYPQRKEDVRRLMREGRLEVGACYTDRLENHHDGESLVRNVVYGKRLLRRLVDMDTKLAAHPDLPGLTEQTPQIYHQAGVKYYAFARGYHNGARFRWAAPNGESIIGYNFPIHYSYDDYEELYRNLDEVCACVNSDQPLVCLSAGDLGDYGTFQKPGLPREETTKIIDRFNQQSDRWEFCVSGMQSALDKMPESALPTYEGECPSKWGTYGSATNVASFKQDKALSALLQDAEKLLALCEAHGLSTAGFEMSFPFRLLEKPHMLRDYYDAKIHPTTALEWLDLAWRLQIITQDHNYGGIDGIPSSFDRAVYKKIGLEIAQNITDFCMARLSEGTKGGEGAVVVNTLNHRRSGKVYLSTECASMEDERGARYATAHDDRGCYFEPVIEALGYGCFRPSDVKADEIHGTIIETAEGIRIESSYYTAEMSLETGGLTRLIDRESGVNLFGKTPVGVFSLYADPSNDVHEELYHKRLLATTRGRVTRTETGDDASGVWLRWYSEIDRCIVSATLRLSHQKKEFCFTPEIHWVAHPQSQLRMSLALNPSFVDRYYGVPYGIEKVGRYMYGCEPTNPTDEISMELFHEYREVQGWLAAQSATDGVSIATDQSAIAFRDENDLECVLIRDVVSCGDIDVMMDNHGHHTFTFTGTSFHRDDVTENDAYYRRSQEVTHPLLSAELQPQGKGMLPDSGILLCAEGGILSVLRAENGSLTARFFSVAKREQQLSLSYDGRALPCQLCDLLEQPLSGDLTMRYGDIKTVRCALTPKEVIS